MPRPVPPVEFQFEPYLLENGAAPFPLAEEASREIAGALGVIVYPLLDTEAWPPHEQEKLAAHGHLVLTAEHQLEYLIGTYRACCELARRSGFPPPGSTIAALKKLLRAQGRLQAAQVRRGVEGERRRKAASVDYQDALLRVIEPKYGLDYDTIEQLTLVATECLDTLTSEPSRLPSAAHKLASAVRQRIKELEALGRVLPEKEHRDWFLALLGRFFVLYARPERNTVEPDDRQYHRFVLAVLSGGGMHAELVEGHAHNPGRLTKILANLPTIP